MLAFVVLHYQAFEETIKCIESIKHNAAGDKKIIVVDNKSPNGSGNDLIKKYKSDSEVEVLLLDSNQGFANGNNAGFKLAKKFNPSYIVVMNNDVMIIEDDIAEKINQAYEETEFDVLGPDIFSTRDHYHQNPQKLNNYTLEELIQYSKRTKYKLDHKWLIRIKYFLPFSSNKSKHTETFISDIVENCVLHGACYVFSKKYIQSHDNCFYNGTFMYFESYILQYLGNREGLKMIYYPEIKVEHHEDVATDQAYSNKYKKSIFTNKCLLDSCNAFIDVIRDPKKRIG